MDAEISEAIAEAAKDELALKVNGQVHFEF
jgi:hypothetical protein